MSVLTDILTTQTPAEPQDDRPRRVVIDGRSVYMTGAEYRAWKKAGEEAAAELASRHAQQTADRKAGEEARRTEHASKIAAERDAELMRAARAAFVGTDAEFADLWPAIRRDLLVKDTVEATSRRQQETMAAMRARF